MSNSRRSSITNNESDPSHQSPLSSSQNAISVYSDYASLVTASSDIDLYSSFIGAYRLNAAEHFDDGSLCKKKGTPKRVWIKFRLTHRHHNNVSECMINLMAKSITQKNFSNRKNIGFYKRGSFAVTSIANGLKCVVFPLNDASKLFHNREKIDLTDFANLAKLVRPRMIAINDTVTNNEKHPPMMITSGKDQSGGSTIIAFFADPQIWGENVLIEAESVSIESRVLAIDMQLFQSCRSPVAIAKSFQTNYEDLPITVPLMQKCVNGQTFSYVYPSKKRFLHDDDDDDRPVKRSKTMYEYDLSDHSDEESCDECLPPSSPSNDSVFSQESMSESDDDAMPYCNLNETVDEEYAPNDSDDDRHSLNSQEKYSLFSMNAVNACLLPCPSPPFSSQLSACSSVDDHVNNDYSFTLISHSSLSPLYLSNFSLDHVFDPSLQIQSTQSAADQSINVDESASSADEWQPPYLDNEAESAIMKNYRPTSPELSDDQQSDASLELSYQDLDSSTVVGAIRSHDSDHDDDDDMFF